MSPNLKSELIPKYFEAAVTTGKIMLKMCVAEWVSEFGKTNKIK